MLQPTRRSLGLTTALTLTLVAAQPVLAQPAPISPNAPAAVTSAAPLPRATPETVGMSAERLSRIDAALRAEVDREQIAGAVIAVARRGRLVHYQAIGYLDRDRKSVV